MLANHVLPTKVHFSSKLGKETLPKKLRFTFNYIHIFYSCSVCTIINKELFKMSSLS